jgi:hypothetical protein
VIGGAKEGRVLEKRCGRSGGGDVGGMKIRNIIFNNYEPIQHLCIDYVLTKFIWRVIQISFGLGPPNNI